VPLGCGLVLSSLLSEFGVNHVLFERHASTSNLPKAHYLNQRSMEIFRQHDMMEPISKIAGKMRYVSRVSWITSLGGDGPFEQKHIASIEAFGGGEGSEQANTYM
jgi:2,4-dichlorophenol 6-monooxygenase